MSEPMGDNRSTTTAWDRADRPACRRGGKTTPEAGT